MFQWHALDRTEQAKYYDMARKEKELHMQLYPGWSARDNYAIHSKKKKRKREPHTPDNRGRPFTHVNFESKARRIGVRRSSRVVIIFTSVRWVGGGSMAAVSFLKCSSWCITIFRGVSIFNQHFRSALLVGRDGVGSLCVRS